MAAPAKASAAGAPQSYPPGSLFGLPGITRYSDQRENNDGMITTLQGGSQVDAVFQANFKQSDIVETWQAWFTISPSITLGGATLTASPYFPYNTIGPVQLNLQNQFNTVDLQNGIELAWRQFLRPPYRTYVLNPLDQAPASNAYSAESNYGTASNYTTSSTKVQFSLDFPGGIFMDLFYVLDSSGQLFNPQPIRAFVSPQFMAGSQRIIQPRVRYNGLFSTSRADNSPYTYATGTPTTTGTATINWQRTAIYQPAGDADSPLLFNWQYTFESRQYSLSGVSQITLPISYSGQILSITLRFFDPSSGSVGAPIDPNTALTECDLLFGSGLYRYQDRPTEMQRRFIRQHGMLPFQGFLCWDMALDKYGRMTNANILNTLDTANVSVYLNFASAQSSTAYVSIIVEGFKYIAMQ